jgi:hypothetical protein
MWEDLLIDGLGDGIFISLEEAHIPESFGSNKIT